ncbi:hypothetical protein GCM10027047_10470 [Rhodococcus aerolatus]
MPNSSATLTVWASAWLAGAAAPDDVLDALTPWAPLQRAHAGDRVAPGTTGLPEPGEGAVGAAALFTALRAATPDGVHLVLPVPGDVRGLPPGTEFAAAALAQGQGVLAPGAGLGLVPVPEGQEMVRWVAFAVPRDARVPDHVGLGEAEHGLRQAVRDTARAMAELDVAGGDATGVRGRIAAVLRARPSLGWPPAMPPRALRVLDQADEVAAILAAAQQDSPGGARTAGAAARRDDLLRPLWTAVRDARRAAVVEAVRVITAGRAAS